MNPHTWVDEVSQSLIRHAARRAPPALTERLEEEWLADVVCRGSGFSRLRFALGCCWATVVIGRELGVAVRAAAVAHVNKAALVHADPEPTYFSRRTVVLLMIVSLHVLVICALAAGIITSTARKPPDSLIAEFLPQPTHPLPTPLTVDPKPVGLRLNPPLPPEPPVPPERTTPGIVTQPPPPQVPVSPVTKTVTRVVGGPGVGFPIADDYYPEPAIRFGEQGVAAINVCVDASGRLTAAPTVDQSTGSSRLDASALKLARAGSGHYRPTTEDGHPVSSCYPLRVRFHLK